MGAAKRKQLALSDVSDKIKEIALSIPDSFDIHGKSVLVTGSEEMKRNPELKLNPLGRYRMKVPILVKMNHEINLRRLLFENTDKNPNDVIKEYITSIDERNKELNKLYVQSK